MTAEISTPVTSQLLAAVSRVMADVRRLEKADNNAFAKYKFTSSDDFKDHLRPLLAKNGLSVAMDEDDVELTVLKNAKGEDKTNARFKFAITLKHESGEIEQPDHTTVFIDLTGPQSTGAARTYALKEWFKSRFLASSGDISEDPDSHETQSYSTAPQRSTKANGRETYGLLLRELRNCPTRETLKEWAGLRRKDIESLPAEWTEPLRADYEAHKDSLPGPVAAAPKTDAFGLEPVSGGAQ